MIIVKKPKIRFKGFTETWEQRKLETYLQEYNEVTSTNNQYPALTSSRKGLFLQTDYFSGNQVASENNIGYNVVPYGYFTYRHMSDDEVFHFNLNDIVDKGIVSTLYPVFTTSKELDSKYLQYQLNYGEEFSRFARLQKQGGSRTYMYLNKLRKLSLTMPNTLDEQKEISAILSTLDHFITLHQRKCENLKKLKKFMLQKLFPQNGKNVPKVRFLNFTDTWEQRKLGEYVSITSGEAPSKFDKGTELYVKVDDLNYNDKYVVDTQNKVAEHSTVKRVTKGSVVFPKRGAAIMTNKVRIMGIDSYIDTNMMALTSEKLDSEFLYNIISKEGLYKIADTSTIPQINNKHVEPYEVTIPSLAEQRRIGAYFKQLDHLITLHQSKCDKLKEVKKYMLQNMFI